MNPFLKKEVRQLLPATLAVLALAVISPWLFLNDTETALNNTPFFIFFGMILVSVDLFGREFSLGTFSSLLSQPIPRRQIWRTKITLLFAAAALILVAYLLSCQVVFHLALSHPQFGSNPTTLGRALLNARLGGCAAVLIALTGGLWTTLLLRQLSAAFWITFLTPLAFLMLIALFTPAKWTDSDYFTAFLYGLAVIYSVAGFWLAHRCFHRAQDVAWTGGVIAFSRWRYFESTSTQTGTVRRLKPLATLLKKEFQLQSISLFCVGALLVLHVGVIIMRACFSPFQPNSVTETISEFFWAFWVVVPLVIGCTTVAEERKLGVIESQFCLPVSRRTQFLIKFFPALVLGVLLGAVMPLLLEHLAARFHAPNPYLTGSDLMGTNFISGYDIFLILLYGGVAGLGLLSILASTLSKNFMQALSFTIVFLIAFFLFAGFLTEGRNFNNGELVGLGRELWGVVLPVPIGILAIAVGIPWLSYRNFSYFAEANRLWPRNLSALLALLVFVFAGSALIYHRVWEVFKPVEPPHGAARLNLTQPPELQFNYSSLQIRLPDGRLWYDGLGNYNYYDDSDSWHELLYEYCRILPKSLGPEQFLAGSNWVSSVPTFPVWNNRADQFGYLDTVAIRADGTLWISSKTSPPDWTFWTGGVQSDGSFRISKEITPPVWNGNNMVQFGDETNWQQVAREGINFLLLKKDGSLWQWGTNHTGWPAWETNWPTVRHTQPRQIGTGSDWVKLFSSGFISSLAQKTDGSLWGILHDRETGRLDVELEPGVPDQNDIASFSWLGSFQLAYVRNDGTLWFCNRQRPKQGNGWGDWQGTGFLQVGGETDWVAVAVTRDQLIALKKDGTLWQWNFPEYDTRELAHASPKRLGIHNDWVAMNSLWEGTLTLAADGSLWFWPCSNYFDGAMLQAPRQPKFIANIFTSEN
jgi:ABC-type transport system involved in multi-copper enzyme maturation permease subunit